MKKQLLAIVFMLVLTVSMFGCSNELKETNENQPESSEQQLTKDEMLASAETLDLSTFHDVIRENEARAMQEYDGNVYKCTAFVEDIDADKVLLGVLIMGDYYNGIFAELPTDEIANLSVDDEITVVGVMEYEESPNVSSLTNAFIVNE